MTITEAKTAIAKIYIAAFNRVPDSAGLDFWTQAYIGGSTLASISSGFTSSAEHANTYPTTQTNAEYVAAIYLNVFGRTGDTAGLAFWESAVNAGTLTHATLMNEMITAATADAANTDGQKLTNKATFGVAVVDAALNVDSATAQLVNITADAATITTATAAISGNATLALTTTAGDIISGTTGNDTITAAAGTYQTTDVLTGGAGTDTLNLALTATNTGLATVTGVENINVNVTSFAATTFDATNVTPAGSTITVNNLQVGGTVDATITNLGTGATVAAGTGVTGTLSVTTSTQATQALTLAANTVTTQTVALHGTAGTADVATVAAAGTVGLTTNGTSQIETVNLSGNGAAATYAITGAATTYTLTGTQSVTLAGNESSFDGKTVTDSTTAGTTTLSITTSGDSDLSLTSLDLIDITSSDAARAYTVRAGQAIKISDTTTTEVATFDISNNATSNVTGAITVDLAGVLTTGKGIALNATTSDDYINALTITNNTSDQATANIIAANAAVTITGTKVMTLETTSTATSINAAGLSGVLTVNYDGTNDIATVTGGTANDIFTNATSAIVVASATINGGAGNDTFTMLSTSTATLNGGDGTADKLVLAGTNDATNLTLSGIEVISLTGTGIADFNASQLSGKTYIITGDATADTIQINDALSIDTMTIDLSGLVIDTTNVTSIVVDGTAISAAFGAGNAQTFTGSSTADTYTGNNGADTISGGAGADILNGGTGADTITGGEGADTITGGADIDTISLTETTAVADIVSLTGVTAAANRDVITGFTSASDVLKLDIDYTTVATAAAGAAVTQTSTITQLTAAADFNLAGLAATSGKDLYILAGGNETTANLSAATDGAELLKYLGTAGNAATGLTVTATTNAFYIAAYDAGNTYVYQVTEGATGAGDTQALAADINLVATLTGTAAVVAADFVMIA